MKNPSIPFFSRRPVALAAAGLVSALMVSACGGGSDNPGPAPLVQPVISAQKKAVITVDDKQFKDLNANGKLDPYEDWRLDTDKRVDDLVAPGVNAAVGCQGFVDTWFGFELLGGYDFYFVTGPDFDFLSSWTLYGGVVFAF